MVSQDWEVNVTAKIRIGRTEFDMRASYMFVVQDWAPDPRHDRIGVNKSASCNPNK